MQALLPASLPDSALLAAYPRAAGKSGESPSALLQLPHFDGDVLKKLARKKVKTLAGELAEGRQGVPAATLVGTWQCWAS